MALGAAATSALSAPWAEQGGGKGKDDALEQVTGRGTEDGGGMGDRRRARQARHGGEAGCSGKAQGSRTLAQ